MSKRGRKPKITKALLESVSKFYGQELRDHEIAKELNVCVSTIKKCRQKLELKGYSRRGWGVCGDEQVSEHFTKPLRVYEEAGKMIRVFPPAFKTSWTVCPALHRLKHREKF